ncbi:MAG: DUF1211 domain-containing protein [Thermoplasmatales archaeon]|nr:MAG: DUF1211 domain-containing protein [Thermoplasmatales archaeon]
MTILVLELSLDETIINTFAWLPGGNFTHTYTAIYAYVLGFITLGIYWAFHHYIFHFIKRSNGVLVWLNVLFLMFAALVPFSTVVNQAPVEHSVNSHTTEVLNTYPAYAFNMLTTIITFLLLFVIWQYATRKYRLVDRDIRKEIINFVNKIIIIGSTIASIVLIITYFIPWFGYMAFIPMAYVIIAIAYGHHKPFF